MTEIAERTGLHKSTVHRMLSTLEAKGFVERDRASDRYRLGMRVWELSANLSQSDDPAVIWLPEMERLRDELGETVSIYVRDGKERIRIQAVQSNLAVRRVAPVGVRLPLFVGASGKVLIAYADPAEQEALMREADAAAVGDLERFREQLADIRRIGYATSMEEREQGAAAVSAPIFNHAGKLAGALSVSGPAGRLTMDIMRQCAPQIMESALRMGTMLR